MSYIWENEKWPHFHYDKKLVSYQLDLLNAKIEDTDKLFEILDYATKSDICHAALTSESLSSSKIEGITLHANTVANSLAKKLGTSFNLEVKTDDYSKSVSEVIWDAVTNTKEPITFDRLYLWQTKLTKNEPTVRSTMTIGSFRTGFVGVYSGHLGKETLEYIAPPANVINTEMSKFVDWINSTNEQSAIVKSAICSLWFVAIHPFDDGNGRISRALADYIISKERPFHYFSISNEIDHEKSQYYKQLGLVTGQSASLDITDWICWYIGIIKKAVQNAYMMFVKTVRLTRIMNSQTTQNFNSRQKDIIYRLSSGIFFGNLTNEKYSKIEKCSSATATRDLSQLTNEGFLEKSVSGGRSTAYILKPDLL